ncbi:MAG TPA: hypothetical protein VLH60_00225, partial [Sedimentisphaerales bacterium]|nr:hypothetical protein [Sedimentisphaerales bacterium]
EEHYQNALKAYKSGDMTQALSEVKKSLEIRPTYTEALRLQQKLQDDDSAKTGNSLEKIMLTESI